METKHHKTQTRYIQTLMWHIKPHTLTLSFAQGCDPLMIFQSKSHPPFPRLTKVYAFGSWMRSQIVWLKYENHMHDCDTLLSCKPTTGGLYSCLFFCSLLLCCRCRCHHNPLHVCLKLNVWPTHVFLDFLIQARHKSILNAYYVQVVEWGLWVCIHKISLACA